MRKIMLIDDEINVLRALRRDLVRHYPADVLQLELFDDPRDALLWAAEHSFDVAIADYRMPHADGVSLLKSLRDIQPDTVRMIVSGTCDYSVLISAINEAHIFRFIAKPWNQTEIVDALRDALAYRDGSIEVQRLAQERRTQKDVSAKLGSESCDAEFDANNAAC